MSDRPRHSDYEDCDDWADRLIGMPARWQRRAEHLAQAAAQPDTRPVAEWAPAEREAFEKIARRIGAAGPFMSAEISAETGLQARAVAAALMTFGLASVVKRQKRHYLWALRPAPEETPDEPV